MSDRKPKTAPESGEERDDHSFLDSVLIEEGAEGGDDGEYGLELDDSQAQEVRQIFFTTLPQYLQPIEEMLEQLFAAEQVPEDLCTALLTTVSSIGAAAARLGIEAVREPLEQMQDEISQLMNHAQPSLGQSRKALFNALAQLTALTVDPAAPAKPRAQTIFAAFKHVDGIDRAVLEKLTAAGLVTVDQIQMAEPSEIAAVSGLNMTVVRALISALSNAAAATSAALDPPAAAPAAGGDELEALHAEVRSKLQARVEAEAAVEAARAGLARTRHRRTELQRELAEMSARREGLRQKLEVVRERLAGKLAALTGLRARRDGVEREQAAARDALRRTEADAARLDQEKRVARETHAELVAQLNQLGARVQRLLAATEPRRPYTHTRTVPSSDKRGRSPRREP